MAKQVQLRRGTTAQHGSFTGAAGEVTVDTDLNVLRVHDGSTAGGHRTQAYDADTAKTDVAQQWTAQQGFSETTITYSATPGYNGNTDQVAKITLTGNPTFAAPTNIVEGNFYQITVIQDATGGRVAAWNAAYKNMAAATPVTTANAVNVYRFRGGASNTLQLIGFMANAAQ